MTLPGDMTMEKAMQLIKGGFSYRLKREFGYQGEVWQRGFSEVRINDGQSFMIANIWFRTLSKQGSSRLPSNTPTVTLTWQSKKPRGLKPDVFSVVFGPTKVVP
jgi:putative transposase